ncbi:uncharacterized protein LOC128249946 [Octopus bimaculoides]|uniref:uncharacterized protein LOC128249946 n=1 Tax=Octopus bimaculoides TaxID=37653 RepID=UPI0022E334A7|nr:uncharacterized protein LOC128249946 [Octopus bimaculoides]
MMKLIFIYLLLIGEVLSNDRCVRLARKFCKRYYVEYEKNSLMCKSYKDFLDCFLLHDDICYENFKTMHKCSHPAEHESSSKDKAKYGSVIITAFVGIFFMHN